MQQGQVVRLDRKQCEVALDEGGRVRCTLRGRFFEHEGGETRPVAVGDRVLVAVAEDQGTVESVLPRTSEISRGAVQGRGKVQVLAANVDTVVLVTTLRQPKARPGMVDRLLAAAEFEHLDAVVVLNKVDLCKDQEVAEFRAPYEELGYRVLAVSATEGTGVDALREALRDQTVIFVGHSGVGKSSLLNALDPRLALTTRGLMREGKGRHTTTHHELMELAGGLRVIDGPGIREYTLVGIPPAGLGALFREIRPLEQHCRYPDCTHDHEPDCAVKAAAAAGRIRASRFQSYRKLLEELHGGGQRMPRHGSF